MPPEVEAEVAASEAAAEGDAWDAAAAAGFADMRLPAVEPHS